MYRLIVLQSRIPVYVVMTPGGSSYKEVALKNDQAIETGWEGRKRAILRTGHAGDTLSKHSNTNSPERLTFPESKITKSRR